MFCIYQKMFQDFYQDFTEIFHYFLNISKPQLSLTTAALVRLVKNGIIVQGVWSLTSLFNFGI